jgi:hypothetical protein
MSRLQQTKEEGCNRYDAPEIVSGLHIAQSPGTSLVRGGEPSKSSTGTSILPRSDKVSTQQGAGGSNTI